MKSSEIHRLSQLIKEAKAKKDLVENPHLLLEREKGNEYHPGQDRVLFGHNGGRLSRFVSVMAPRRWGKSEGFIRYAGNLAARLPGRRIAYVAQQRSQAKAIVWDMLDDLDKQKKWGLTKNNVDLVAKWPNGSWLSLHGTDKPNSMRLLRGLKFDLVIIDEAQNFCYIDVASLVQRVLMPCLTDRLGRLLMGGTPGEEEFGYFFETQVSKKNKEWNVNQGEQFENPYTASQVREQEEILRTANPNIDNEPWFMREQRGIWVTDTRNNVIKLSPELNHLTSFTPSAEDVYYLGIDFGFNDPSAYVLAVVPAGKPYFVYLEGWEKTQMYLHDHVEAIKGYISRYPGITIVGDPGGVNKTLIEELINVYGLPMERAEKKEKRHFVEQTNSEASLGIIKIYNQADPAHPELSPIARQWQKLVRIRNPRTGEWTEGEPRHMHDAAIYARRRALLGVREEEKTMSFGEREAIRMRDEMVNKQTEAAKLRNRNGDRPWLI